MFKQLIQAKSPRNSKSCFSMNCASGNSVFNMCTKCPCLANQPPIPAVNVVLQPLPAPAMHQSFVRMLLLPKYNSG
jgi:hypothetical protein